ncbi:hypothetical protein RFI_07965 [Reticulomyxa filosa]|uniref:EF-hand domain-containing protein n=1 Tax=Reticulomyxa filosa TaxID=46433 RepID=X6NT82_RETFI|nr:hypothetical protein RFI_07965 [Reticulomyxa filosa]|eukprot:ETO29163.1 hypothetical protein RFI_07965 [Reticulomyxa filosa]
MDAISKAFYEIDTKQSGFIMFHEFEAAYERYHIRVYGGLKSLFTSISKGKDRISLADFTSVFSSSVYNHRTAVPTTKDILEQAHFLRFQTNNIDGEKGPMKMSDDELQPPTIEDGEDEDGIPAVPENATVPTTGAVAIGTTTAPTTTTAKNELDYEKNNAWTRHTDPSRTSYSDGVDSIDYDVKTIRTNPGDQDNILEDDENENDIASPHLYQHSSGNNVQSELPKVLVPDFAKAKHTNSSLNENDTMYSSNITKNRTTAHSSNNEDLHLTIDKPLSELGLEMDDLFTSIKSPHATVQLSVNEVWERVYNCYISEVWRMSWPACLMLVPLHVIQTIWKGRVHDNIQVFMWYTFGVLLYLTFQSTMIGYRITTRLFWLSIGTYTICVYVFFFFLKKKLKCF